MEKTVYRKLDKNNKPHTIQIEQIKTFPKGAIMYQVYIDGLYIGEKKTKMDARKLASRNKKLK